MKKILLSITAISAVSAAFAFGHMPKTTPVSDIFQRGPEAPAMQKASSTRATSSIYFSYADEPYTAYSLSNIVPANSCFALLIQLSPEDIKNFAGNKVTGFTICSPTDYNGTKNTIKEGQLFYTTDLASERYTQNFEFSTEAFVENEIALETPYTISGTEENLYFGYSFIIPKLNDMYYIPVDGVPNSYPGSLIFGFDTEGGFPTQFDNSGAAEIGALCMSIKIEGNSLPENIASISTIYTPSYLPLSGDGSDVAFDVKNIAGNDLSSVEVVASVTGMPDLVKTFDFDPIPFGKKVELSFPGIKADTESFVDLSMKITKANGVACDGNVQTVSVPAYDNGFLRKIVAEDATGTWCGYCPGGIEALEYLKTTYPDKAIAIGVHCGSGPSAPDPMEIEEYMDFIYDYVQGFPTVLYNRMISQTPTSPYTQVCNFIDQVAEYYNSPSYAQVALEGESAEDGTTASVTASAEFKVATSVPHYLSFVIVEDGVGPYMQSNYFKQKKIPMNGWEKKNSKVSTIYNDVARYYDCYPGIEGSLPAAIEANSVNTYSIELPLSNVKGNEYRVVALLTNAMTGEIVNAEQYSMTKDNGAAVESISTENAPAEYFDLTGRKVVNPEKGVYIKKTGSKSEKILF